MRVLEGGHNIEPEVIERRYLKGIKNLFDIYLPIVDYAFIIDNSFEDEELIAKKILENSFALPSSILKAYNYKKKMTMGSLYLEP